MKTTIKLLILETHKSADTTPASLTATSGTPQSANCGAAFAAALVATVKNAAGVGLPNVAVTFTAPGTGASGTFASTGTATETVVTNGNGVATSSAFTANTIYPDDVTYNVTAAAGALSCTFALTNHVVYKFRDEFSAAKAAPLGTPLACDVLGSWNVADTNNVESITGGELVGTGSTGGGGNPRLVSVDSFTRAAGLAFVQRAKSPVSGGNSLSFGWSTQATPAFSDTYGGMFTTGGLITPVSGLGLTAISANVYSIYYVIARTSTGYFVVQDNRLLYVGSLGTGTPLYAVNQTAVVAGRSLCTTDYTRVVQLGAPWTTELFWTSKVAIPASGEIITQEADAIIELTWIPAANEVVDIQFRRTDDNNCWIVRADQANSKLYLYEKQTGTETERGAAGGVATTFTVANAYRLYLQADGAVIRLFVVNNVTGIGTPKQGYSSATFNQTATGTKASGFAQAANFIAWPVALSGAALSALTGPFLEAAPPIEDLPTVLFADNLLEADIQNGAYSIANRDASGTDGNAFMTVNGAINHASAGDIIYIRAGAYRELTNIDESHECCFLVNKAVTVIGYPGEAITLTYDPDNLPMASPTAAPDDYGPIVYLASDNVTLSNFTVSGTRALKVTRGSDQDSNIQFEGDTHQNITISHLTIEEAGHCGIKYNGSNILVERCLIRNNGTVYFDHGIYSSQEHGRNTIRFCWFENNRGRGIQLYNGGSFDIYGCVFYDNWLSGPLIGGPNCRVCNNVMYLNGIKSQEAAYGGFCIYKTTASNLTFINNLSIGNNLDINLDDPGLAGSTISHNYYHSTYVNRQRHFDDCWPDDGSDVVVAADFDPGFVDATPTTWPDFRLAAASVLIDAGTTTLFTNLLDPAYTDWPTPYTPGGTMEVGAFGYKP